MAAIIDCDGAPAAIQRRGAERKASIMSQPITLAHRVAPLKDKPPGQLLIHEVYRSVQGESIFAGLPCVFVRLAVCDLRCVWCDTPHAFKEGTLRPLDDILKQVVVFDCPLVEITGGEPLLQPEVFPLMTALADAGRTVLLETSGAADIGPVDRRVHIIMDLKCPDSGECDANRWTNLEVLKPTDEIKFVIATRRDFDWAAEIIRRHRLDRRFTVLLSPVFDAVTPRQLADWLLESGLNIRMQLQLHKQIWAPDARGV
jgi:7-carboxy-7-deazaguanine synthase